jgi:hypothetical protein
MLIRIGPNSLRHKREEIVKAVRELIDLDAIGFT